MRTERGASRRATRVAALVAGICASLALLPAAAGAELTYWRTGGPLGAGAMDADVTRTQLTSSWAWADGTSHKAQAGAHYPGGWTLYGGWQEDWYWTCQSYPSLNLGSLIRNPHTVTVSSFQGWAGWVYNRSGTWC